MNFYHFFENKKFVNKLILIMDETNKIAKDIYNKLHDISNNYKEADNIIQMREDGSYVTEADILANKHLCEKILEINNYYKKDILIISEENNHLEYYQRKKYDWIWLIDPIKGTENFINKNEDFSINIGLCYKGKPVFGIIGYPMKDEIYYGLKYYGSYKIKNNIKNKIKREKKENKVITFNRNNDYFKNYIKKYDEPITLQITNTDYFKYLVENKSNLYVNMDISMEWTTCAEHAILKYIGFKMVRYLNQKKQLRYNNKYFCNPFFIVF